MIDYELLLTLLSIHVLLMAVVWTWCKGIRACDTRSEECHADCLPERARQAAGTWATGAAESFRRDLKQRADGRAPLSCDSTLSPYGVECRIVYGSHMARTSAWYIPFHLACALPFVLWILDSFCYAAGKQFALLRACTFGAYIVAILVDFVAIVYMGTRIRALPANIFRPRSGDAP